MRTLLAMSLAATLVTGCAVDAPTDSAIDPRVTVLSQIAGPEMTVTADGLEFPRSGNDALLDLAAGDLVVSGTGPGFLRNVVSIASDRDRIVIATTDAALGDALIDGEVGGSFGGEGKADTHQLPAIGFSIRDRVVVNNEKMTVKVVNASLALQPEIDLDVQVTNRRLSLFELVVRGRLTGSIDLAIDAREVALGPTLTLWKSPPAYFYQQIGLLPVVETVTTSVELKLEVVARGQGTLRINASTIAQLEAGIRFDPQGGWTPVAGFDVQADGGVPVASATFSELGVRAWLIARADVKLYGVVGPYVAVGPQLEVMRDLVERDFDGGAGFRGEVGGELKVGRFTIGSPLPNVELFNEMTPLF